MDFRQLKYFVAVAEAGSMSAAARTLFVTQPTLTVAVRKLEKSLETELLDRSTTPLTLTPPGKHLFEEGKHILAAIDELAEQTRLLGSSKRTKIRIGFTVLFSMQFMPQIARFMGENPEIEVSLIQSGSRDLQQRLAAGELDCGVVSYPCYESDIEITPLKGPNSVYQASVVVRSDHPLASRDKVTYGDLRGEKFSSLSDKYVLGEMLSGRCQQYGFKPNVVLVNDSWTVLVSSVQNLNSVCVLPYELRSVFASQDVSWVPLEDRISRLPIGIGVLRGRPRVHGVEELMATLRTPISEVAQRDQVIADTEALAEIAKAHTDTRLSPASAWASREDDDPLQ